MAYLTGTVSNVSDLFSIIKTACTDNGYTVNSPSGTVSYFTKGSNNTRLELFSDSSYLGIRNCQAVPEASPVQPYTRTLPFIGSGLTYHIGIFSNPDMFVLNLQYASERAVTLFFGNINKTGNSSPIGGGVAFASTQSNNVTQAENFFVLTNNDLSDGGATYVNYIPFAHCYNYLSVCGNGLAGNGVWDHGVGRTGGFTALLDTSLIYPLFYSPNTWNNQAILFPIDLVVLLGGNSVAPCGTLPHIFLLRIDNYNINDVITIGSDQYKVFTWGKKSMSLGNGDSTPEAHTSAIGYCFKIN
jgi:hypothetical protein